jgi:hypothetical protein
VVVIGGPKHTHGRLLDDVHVVKKKYRLCRALSLFWTMPLTDEMQLHLLGARSSIARGRCIPSTRRVAVRREIGITQ